MKITTWEYLAIKCTSFLELGPCNKLEAPIITTKSRNGSKSRGKHHHQQRRLNVKAILWT
jgi:hypothetical protein